MLEVMSFAAIAFYLLGGVLMASFLYEEPTLVQRHRKRYALMVIGWPFVILFCFGLYVLDRE